MTGIASQLYVYIYIIVICINHLQLYYSYIYGQLAMKQFLSCQKYSCKFTIVAKLYNPGVSLVYNSQAISSTLPLLGCYSSGHVAYILQGFEVQLLGQVVIIQLLAMYVYVSYYTTSTHSQCYLLITRSCFIHCNTGLFYPLKKTTCNYCKKNNYIRMKYLNSCKNAITKYSVIQFRGSLIFQPNLWQHFSYVYSKSQPSFYATVITLTYVHTYLRV